MTCARSIEVEIFPLAYVVVAALDFASLLWQSGRGKQRHSVVCNDPRTQLRPAPHCGAVQHYHGGNAVVENFLRSLMTHAGVAGQFQKPVLIVVAVLLILLALRLFGRLFGALIAVFVVLLLLHILLPSLGHSSAVHLQL